MTYRDLSRKFIFSFVAKAIQETDNKRIHSLAGVSWSLALFFLSIANNKGVASAINFTVYTIRYKLFIVTVFFKLNLHN